MAFKKLKLWFDEALCDALGNKIVQLSPSFPKKDFLDQIAPQLDELELKARVALIGQGLDQYLNGDYKSNIQLLLQILGPENNEETGMFKNYYDLMPIASYVEQFGLVDFDSSMIAIEDITKRNTGEYTIRPFLEKFPSKTLNQMISWSYHDNFHVRRLACEGVRPRLPWAKKLDSFIKDPTPILPILEQLKDDKSKYVQKSVANCINDIFKDNSRIAEELINDWQHHASSNRKWIIKHALRNLIKKEDQWALTLVSNLK